MQCDVRDVLVIGGGPAGSTISALLAEKGWQVTLLEKDRHPRFHIGESLLPMNLCILERLGVLDQVREIGVPKYGADFHSEAANDLRRTYYFGGAMDKRHPYAFEVRRSEFDHILLKNSAAKGVDVREGIRVADVDLRGGHARVVHALDEQGNKHCWEARYVIDASGRDTFLGKRLNLKVRNPTHGSAAIFAHFTKAVRRTGRDEGNISVYWFRYGWFWMIPLKDDVMSVGAVCWPEYLKGRKNSPEEFLWDTVKLCPGAHARLKDARMVGEARATGNYSYSSKRIYGDGYLLVGDAFAFVDPVFSSGVYLAMVGAEQGAIVVDQCLRDERAGKKLLRQYDRRTRRALRLFSWFIYRFTSPAFQRLFMHPRNMFRMQEAVISMLAGDLFRKTPVTMPLLLFKVVYYLTALSNIDDAWPSYRRRIRNARLAFSGGTMPQDREG